MGMQRAAPSSGNVFADLRLPNAEEKQTKARLAVAINQIIAGQELSQVAAARRLKINQPKISALAHYRLEGFSVERLMHFLTALDRERDGRGHPEVHHRDRRHCDPDADDGLCFGGGAGFVPANPGGACALDAPYLPRTDRQKQWRTGGPDPSV